jgi:hypothetical protein
MGVWSAFRTTSNLSRALHARSIRLKEASCTRILASRCSHLDARISPLVSLSTSRCQLLASVAIQARLETTKDPPSSTDSGSFANLTTMLYALRSRHPVKLGLPVCSSVVTGRFRSAP